MTLLIIGLVIFLGVHSVRIVADDARARLIGERGENVYKSIYSLISLIGFVLIIMGYGAARVEGAPILYDPPAWTRHLVHLLMIPVFVMLFAAYLPGRIRDTLKHPMLVAVKTWAAAHLVGNGDLASVLLFGGFLAWAVFDRISVKRRQTPGFEPATARSPRNDAIAIVAGLIVYALVLLWAHGAMIGVPLVVI